ncbi:phosphatidylserine decarboxylase [Aspergillus arachidicola]|uniref:Phosphatidylserine decarboxylase n=1 Tax=Aspergillus arachidicola TaxID=656916 RepID=A0A2G7FP81_9EURO|nr:phosphatidylserine decarboxylase [Aspergillus arachidicola]
MSVPQYVAKEALVRDLRDFISRDADRTKRFNDAIATAVAGSAGAHDEMANEGIRTLDDYLRFCDDLLQWVPKVSSKGDELLQKILIFYWVFDQPALRGLQTEIQHRSQLAFLLACNIRAPTGLIPEHAAVSFNHWFAREWKDIDSARPLAGPNDDKVVVSVADSKFNGDWDIVDGNVTISGIDAKGAEWPIEKLLQTTTIDYHNGTSMHAFLGPTDYHRQHAPVSGEIIEVKNIQDQVYLQVATKNGGHLSGDRRLIRNPHMITRRSERLLSGGHGYYNLDTPDNAGYQGCQTRGLIVIQTKDYGKVAVLPIGMAQVSSVVMTMKKGDHVKKGGNISYF